MVVLKELILISFYIEMLCWSWKNWFFKQFLYWEGMVILKELILQFLYLEGMVVLKELIFHSFYIGKVWWSWKNWFFTVSILGRYGGLERTDFKQFLYWSWKDFSQFLLLGGMVVLKELIFNSLYIGNVWWSWKSWFLTVAHLGRCGGLERTDFEQFLYSEGVVVLKELIFNSFYIQKVWWSWKNWFWTVSILHRVWWSWKNWFLTVSIFLY